MICPTCQRETLPFGDMDPRLGVVEKCGHLDCKAPMHRPAPPPPQRVQVQPTPPATSPAAHPPQMTEPPVARHVASSVTGASLIDMMRARLSVVEAKLAEMHALVAEEALLRRMLGAAESDTN